MLGRMKGKRRIGHLYVDQPRPAERREEWDSIPRGWISPEGKFFRTRFHWASIASRFKQPRAEDPEVGERSAHQAYAKGWISLGHAGVLNAIGHESVLKSANHPAVATLRRLVSKLPHFSLRVEKQLGGIDAETGRHEDFDVREYDLGFFVRRGKLRKI